MTFTFGELFAGVGGIGLGLERSGMTCKFQVENDPYAIRVLEKHWPNVRRHDDVRTFPPDGEWGVDLIAGGFPCTDISNAGKREGIDGKQSGLWKEFARIIRVLRPRFVLVENVAALLGRGLGRVLGDLAESGYDAEWRVLSARAFGACHLRERVFIVANLGGKRIERFWQEEIQKVASFSWCEDVRSIEDLRRRSDIPKPLLRRISDGVPNGMDRLRCLGNAVVPQISEWIGRRILEADNHNGPQLPAGRT